MENLSSNAVFGMDRTTVIILNDDPFPQGCENEDDQLAMIKGFVQHNYNDLKGPTHWGLLYMCWPAIQFIWGQVSAVGRGSPGRGRQETRKSKRAPCTTRALALRAIHGEGVCRGVVSRNCRN
jgi:hypothetical protein